MLRAVELMSVTVEKSPMGAQAAGLLFPHPCRPAACAPISYCPSSPRRPNPSAKTRPADTSMEIDRK